MKQQPKRKDLVKLTISIPEHLKKWIESESKARNESQSFVITKLLEHLYQLKKNLSTD